MVRFHDLDNCLILHELIHISYNDHNKNSVVYNTKVDAMNHKDNLHNVQP